jgi:hypothetical protein
LRRFILFRGSSLYGSVDRMLEQLAAAFRAGGDRTVIIDATAPDYVEQLQRAIAEGVDAFLGFTGIGLDLRAADNLYNSLDRPLVSIYLDPLLLYWNQVATPIRRRVIFSTAPDDQPYWTGTLGVPIPMHHLPHAADPIPETELVPWAARDIDVLIAGTAPADPEALRAGWAAHGAAVERRLNDSLDAHDADPFAPLPALIAQAAAPVAALNSPESLHPYFSVLDQYLRARARWRMATALLPLRPVFAGPGWERLAPDSLGEQSADAVAGLMRRSRIVANSCTPYHGSHERIFQAMAAGAVSLSSATTWLRDTAPLDALIQLDPTRADPLAEAGRLLAAPDRAEAIGQAGRTWFQSGHRWCHRAGTIKDVLGL